MDDPRGVGDANDASPANPWPTIESLLRNFQGREYSGEVRRETLLFADLGLSSIDAVVLGEMLNQQFGRDLPFHTLLSTLRDRGCEDVSVGELMDFVAQNLSDETES